MAIETLIKQSVYRNFSAESVGVGVGWYSHHSAGM